jgi:hypothetical protein
MLAKLFARATRRDAQEVGPIELAVATWNIAAINRNPFEYWVTYPDPSYNKFMLDVETFLGKENEDLTVDTIFTNAMFLELLTEMKLCGLPELDKLSNSWQQDYSQRKAVRGFLQDTSLGEKRLISMPDRITNTILLSDNTLLKRPTVINAYDESPLNSVEAWWSKWKLFMFHTPVQLFSHNTSKKVETQSVCRLIGPIQKSKYPAVTSEEESMSIPLQILCLGVLDAIFVYIANRVAPIAWEQIRSKLCLELIHCKDSKVCDIIADYYTDRHVIFLQEASSSFVQAARESEALAETHFLLVPFNFDSTRDQNSVMLLHRHRFDEASSLDVTQEVLARFPFFERGAQSEK